MAGNGVSLACSLVATLSTDPDRRRFYVSVGFRRYHRVVGVFSRKLQQVLKDLPLGLPIDCPSAYTSKPIFIRINLIIPMKTSC